MPKRILVVDDEFHITESLRVILEDEGYEVDLCLNGQDALQAYRKALPDRPYDLIILDIIMPGLSGLDVLRAIRQEEKTKRRASKRGVSVLMLTGLKESWTGEAFDDGCSDYMIKPFETQFLLKKVKTLIR